MIPLALVRFGLESGQSLAEQAPRYAVNVKLLPVPQSTSFSGISCLAEIDEVLSAAVHREHMLEIELLELRHHLAQVVIRRRGQVEPADECINLVDGGDLLGAKQGVDDAGMAVGTDHYQPAITQPEAGGMLVPVLIGLPLSGKFLGGEMMVRIGIGIAAQAVRTPYATQVFGNTCSMLLRGTTPEVKAWSSMTTGISDITG